MAKDMLIEEAEIKSYETPKLKKYRAIFKKNQRLDLRIGNEYINVDPFGVIELTETQRNHPDFISMEKDYFTVKEA